MKQTLKMFMLVGACFLMISFEASASSYPAKLGIKLGNGLANIVTGIGEIPKNIMIGNRSDGPAYAATAGVMTGLLHTLGRTFCGVADTATFVIPTKTMVGPNYIWQDFRKETTYSSSWKLLE